MKKLFFFIIILYLNIYSVNEDLLYVEFVGDTVKIWNNAQLNCCSQFRFETEISEGKIKLVEIDTSRQWCKCICSFNLCASLIGLEAGSYKVDVFRKLPPFILPDSLYFVGTLEFTYLSRPLVSSYQSNCLSIAKTSGTAEKNFIIKDDSLYVEFSFDTVKIWNANAVDQCCAKFKIETEISNGLIKLNEIDTSGVACDCICRFNLCGIIVGLQTGKYKVEVYRAGYFVGSIDFYYPPPNQSVILKSYQSECLHTNPDETIIYSNSFESPQDTSDWEGYMDFRSDVPDGGGKQSVFISGGCLWPHAWIELNTLNEEGYYILKCWGKDLDIGGIVYIEAKGDFQNQANITINNKEWTYYESEDTLYCPAGKRIVLAMGAGGIVPSAMLIDLVEIVKINFITTQIEEKDDLTVHSTVLSQNFPNPFNPKTKIKYSIPNSGGTRHGVFPLVDLKVYDILGNEVATLVNEEKPAGSYEVEFDGSKLSSGIYFYVLKAADNRIVRKMSLLK